MLISVKRPANQFTLNTLLERLKKEGYKDYCNLKEKGKIILIYTGINEITDSETGMYTHSIDTEQGFNEVLRLCSLRENNMKQLNIQMLIDVLEELKARKYSTVQLEGTLICKDCDSKIIASSESQHGK